MTPAIIQLKNNNIDFNIHEYDHDQNATSFGLEAAEKLDANPKQIFKTLVLETDKKQLVVAIVPVESQVNLKKLAKACKVKKVIMADKVKVQNSTGYILGGVSPIGQKKRLPTFIDKSAEAFDKIYISAGKRGLEISLFPSDLVTLLQASLSEIRG
ncbi:Cys-tRNA(Pro) deacylase [Pseudoalteromonas denitrificans]|uniref:Cys-tRNA(Pro)/Cys-tRNA(Cys) deacylase n=1 Tax=Pseudoalteromonas denitrificans DSM 6059 TaxID=1123010 RepID=A0A1I1H577_9GAMM|nr:Cys-tRNA(Pro) deacylase [Pseudoalteromonas denitrificans]SFC16583.1 Cys-tRNA(Pro)/Cys-tRNA(Cys) deacylase [Pseudoalteromonas denitrificans DSM 6059]